MTEAMKFLRDAGWKPSRWNDPLRDMGIFRIRERYIDKFGFAILDDATVEALRAYNPLLEVGAGSGYWSYELRLAGIDVIPTDPGTGRYRHANDAIAGWDPWIPIEKLTGVEAVKKYPDRALLIVWPDISAAWPAETLREFRGQLVIYVGEGRGGATGDDDFHEILDREFDVIEEIPTLQFFCIHDFMQILRRKP